jgi:hypothetical protein
MKITEIIDKYYETLLDMCTKKDIALYGGKTSEDLLGDAVLTTMNKFKDSDITEEEGYEYFKKTFLESCLFAYKKKSYTSEKMIEYVSDYGSL